MIKFFLKKIVDPIDPQFTWVIYWIDPITPNLAKWALEGHDYEPMREELLSFRNGHQWWNARRLNGRWEDHCRYSTFNRIRSYYATINL